MRTITIKLLAVTGIIMLLAAQSISRPVKAQISCDTIVAQLNRAIDVCLETNLNTACYANRAVTAQPSSERFKIPKDRVPIIALENLSTNPAAGAAVLHIQSTDETNPVWIILFGGATINREGDTSNVFVLQVDNRGDVCSQTPAGMVVQTETGERGRITVNGVLIELGSTAYLTMKSPETMIIANIEGQVTAIVPGEAQQIPVGYQTQANGIGSEQITLSWPPVPSPYASSPVVRWLAGPNGLTRVTDSNTQFNPEIPACGGKIELGQSLTSQNTVPGQECVYTFCADAGTVVTARADSLTPEYNPYIDLRGPNGRLIKANNDISADNINSLICNQGLPETSCDYMLVVRPSQNQSAGQFALSLNAKSECAVIPERCEVIVSPSRLNLRSGPGIPYGIVGRLPFGAQMEVLARSPDEAWIQVQVLGSIQEGWVSADYVICDSPEVITPTPVTPVAPPEKVDQPTPTPTPCPKCGPYGGP